MRRLSIILIAVCLACKPAQQQSTKPGAAAAGPTVRATVVTLRTTVQPSKQTILQTIVVAGDRVRDTSERDAWRLYDTKAQTVTFVDDIDKTIRTESFASLSKKRAAVLAAEIAPFHPRPALTRGGRKTIQGANAEQWTIATGAYKRELWIGEHPSIPRGLFAMMQASERISSPLAPLMRDVDAAILGTKGFPLIDRSEVPIGNPPMAIERSVVSIAQKDVPQSWTSVPNGYRDLTEKQKPK